ncbi:MAG: transposase [Acidobacteria bacterium]|nr:transposase [Acidobacteriota bacterium]
MTVVAHILNQMPAIHKPQRKFLLALFATIACLRGRVNFRNLARYSTYSERTFHRQFRKEFDFAKFNQLAITQAVSPAATLLLAQDASFISKSGKRTYGLDRFFNGCAHRVERGLEVSAIALVDVTGASAFTLSVKQTPPRPLSATTHVPEETRMDFYLEHFLESLSSLPEQVTKLLLVDGAFARRKFIDGVRRQQFHLITKLRSDANLRFLYTGEQRPGRGRRRQFAGKVSFSDLSRFDFVKEVEPGLALYTQVVNSVTLKRSVRIVVVLDERKLAKPRYVVLASTDCELAAELIFSYYATRFQIEFLFRDAKQFTGLTQCQARDQEALHFHLNAALAAVNIAKIEELKESKPAARPVFSLASYKQRAFNEHLLELFISKLALRAELIKNHPQYNYLRNYGAIAA